MSDVYIVTSGNYSAYHIECAFSTEELAKEFIRLRCPDGRLEILSLDDEESAIKSGLSTYQVVMQEDGTVVDCDLVDWHTYPVYFMQTETSYVHLPANTPVLFNRIHATSEEQAIKATNELRARIVATNQWPRPKPIPCSLGHKWTRWPYNPHLQFCSECGKMSGSAASADE